MNEINKCDIHVIIIDKIYQSYMCERCRNTFSKKALEHALQKRFGNKWEAELNRLKLIKMRSKRL